MSAHSIYVRVGRRGLCLIVLGSVFCVLGVGNVLAANQLNGLPIDSLLVRPYRLAIDIMPFQYWGYIFVAAGTIAIIESRWPPGRDVWGFGTLAFVSTMWACVYYAGWLLWDADRGWVGGVLFTQIAILTQVIAGWVEDPESYHERLEGGDDG